MTALQTDLPHVTKEVEEQTGVFTLNLPSYVPANLRYADSDPEINSACMARLGSSDDGSCSGDGYCVYLYDVSQCCSWTNWA